MEYVETASEQELRAVLLALCKDASVEKQIKRHLKQLRRAEAKASKSGEKRKAIGPFFICVRCDDSFNEDNNNSKACTYHPGKSAPGKESKIQVLLTDTT